jgi:hypothetical protein
VTKENIAKAIAYTQGFAGSGGTEMLKGVQMAIDEPVDKERVRIIVMLTDGYIGNEAEIIEHVGKNCGDQVRFWCRRHRRLAQHVPGRRRGEARGRHGQEARPGR